MTVDRTVLSSTMVFGEVRCSNCQKLLMKWLRKGTAVIDVKCTRCSHMNVVALST